MKALLKISACALALGLSFTAQAHRSWLLPSATVLASDKPWVSFDAAVSTDLFYADHVPLRLDSLQIIQPDGSSGKPENALTAKYRSTFDVQLSQPGTYRLGISNTALFASYQENGQAKRWRGTAESFAKEVPADAQELQVSQGLTRVETFVTAGKPGGKALAPSCSGLELVPVTNPNDLFAGEAASFRFLVDGKPAANLKVTVIPGGIRYRSQLGEQSLTTDQDGRFSITWPAAGMYWLEASLKDNKATAPAKERRLGYIATLEVLPQ
jgi:uncharacterized GH25 family protein